MIFIILLGLAILLLISSIVFIVFLMQQRQSFGTLRGNKVYQDTEKLPGEILVSDTLPLLGKPDYIIKQKDMYFPVEFKTGRTPTVPYSGHIMQLIAYCHLIERKFGTRPKHGIIKYPDKEFIIEYTTEKEKTLMKVIDSIMEFKTAEYGDYFTSSSFGICTNCKKELRV